MTWDLKLDATRDLAPGIITGVAETMQRLSTRLQRELGEWFLNVQAGLPWYQEGAGLLGSKNKQVLDLLVRKETLGTEGVNRIVSYESLYSSNNRQYTIAMTLVTEAGIVEYTMTEETTQWRLTV